jgi:hypothetical protein
MSHSKEGSGAGFRAYDCCELLLSFIIAQILNLPVFLVVLLPRDCHTASDPQARRSERWPTLAKISFEGNRFPSSMSERKGPEMPTFFANSRNEKSALSRNSQSRWPKEGSIMCQLLKLAGNVARPEQIWQASAKGKADRKSTGSRPSGSVE